MLIGERQGALAGLFCVLTALSACADSVATAVPIQALTPVQRSAPRLSEVTAEAAPGIAMTPDDFDRIVRHVKAEIAAQKPESFTDPGAPSPRMKLKLIFTRYDEGSAGARFILAGLGQIRIDADVLFIDDATGQVLGRYQVSKQFAFGGLYGGFTRVEDVEKGFAKSVADIFQQKT